MCLRSKGTDVDDKTKEIDPQGRTTAEPFSALVFKIMTDPFVGQLAFIRVYSGKLGAGESIYNVAKGRKERIGRLVKMHANKREDITEVLAGDICAAVGLKSVSTGDTICDEKTPVILESIDFPAPVIQLAIEPKTKADQEKLGMAIAKLVQEDPTLKVSTDPDTGQTILAGMGELHLEIIVDRMQREFSVGANVGKPQVAYRETIRQMARIRLHAQEADRRQRPVRARASCASSRLRGRRVRVRQRSDGRQHSEGIHSGDGKGRGRSAGARHSGRLSDVGRQSGGVRRRLSRCRFVGNGVQDLRVRFASRKPRARPSRCLLEPVMRVEVVVPDEYMGSVNGDLISRRGRLEGTEILGSTHIIKAMVPLSEMFGYATELRSRTQGRGAFTMHFGQYEEVPQEHRRGNHQQGARKSSELSSIHSEFRRRETHGEGKI